MEEKNEGTGVARIAPEQKVATDFPKFIATSMADQIKQADTKAFGTLSIIGIMTAALLSRLSVIKSAQVALSESWILLFGASAVLIIVALKFALAVVYPRLGKAEGKSLIYFKDIVLLKEEEFLRRGQDIDAGEIIRQTYLNAYNLARVAEKKYSELRKAISFTLLALVWTLVILLLS